MGGISWCSYDMLYIQRLWCVRVSLLRALCCKVLGTGGVKETRTKLHAQIRYSFDTQIHIYLSMVWPLPIFANSRIVPNCRQSLLSVKLYLCIYICSHLVYLCMHICSRIMWAQGAEGAGQMSAKITYTCTGRATAGQKHAYKCIFTFTLLNLIR